MELIILGGKNSSESINRYKRKAYDRVALEVKKGYKERIKAYAERRGLSLNGYINGLIAADMGDELTAAARDGD